MTSGPVLGFSIDSGNTPKAVADLDQFVATAAKAESAAESLASTAGKAATEVAAGVSTMSARMTQAANDVDKLRSRYDPLYVAQMRYKTAVDAINQGEAAGSISANLAMQARILETNTMNAQISVLNNLANARKQAAQSSVDRASVMPDRAADLQAYGASLDALRTKYNPLYAIGQQYKMTVLDIKNAHAVGAISANEMSAALERELTQTKRLIELQKMAPGGGATTGPSGMQRQLSSNLMFQLQDVAVTTAMGMSPAMIALQQGTQMGAAITAAGGAKAGIDGLKGAVTSLFTASNLLPIAFVGIGAAIVQHFMAGKEATISLTDQTKKFAATVADIKSAYGAAADGAEDFGKRSLFALRGVADAARETLRLQMMTDSGSGKEKGLGGFADFTDQNDNVATMFMTSAKFKELQGPIGDFMDSVKLGVPEVNKFEAALEAVVKKQPGLRGLADEALGLTDDIVKTALALEQTADAASRMGTILKTSIYGVQSVGQTQQTYIAGLIQKLNNGEMSATQFKAALVSLSGVSPDLSGAIAQVSGLADQLERAKMAASGMANTTPRTGRLGQMDDLAGGTVDQPSANFNDAFNLWRRFGDDGKGGLDPDKPKKVPKGSKVDPWRDLLKSGQDRIDQLKSEEKQLGMTGAAAKQYDFEQDLIRQGTEKGRKLDADKIAAIHKMAIEYGKLAESTAQAKLMQDAMFDRDQMFRSPVEQQIASAQKAAGLAVDLNGPYAQVVKLNAALQETVDLGSDFVHGFFDAIDNGEKPLKALVEGLEDLGKKLLDMALDQSIQALFKNLAGGASSGGGGWGLLTNFLSGGGGNSFLGGKSDPGIIGALGLAKGGAFNFGGSFMKFAKGDIFDSPHLFRFAQGVGMMGEAGPEAVMPLTRGADGKLGVKSSGGGGVTNDNGGSSSGQTHVLVEFSQDLVVRLLQQAKDQSVSVVVQNNEAQNIRVQNGGQAFA